jgi:hypothetical protein
VQSTTSEYQLLFLPLVPECAAPFVDRPGPSRGDLK